MSPLPTHTPWGMVAYVPIDTPLGMFPGRLEATS